MSSKWQKVTVEEIAADHASALATGPFGSSISAKYFQESGVPVIRGSNLSADVAVRLDEQGLVFLTDEKAREFKRSTVTRGDLVFTCWGTINQVGLIDRRSTYDCYVISNKQMKLTVDPLKVDARFIYYVFSGPKKQAEIVDNGIGSSVPGFNLGQFRRHELLLPALHEQASIADFLDTFDDRMCLLNDTNSTLEAMAQAMFKSWFVDFDPVRAKLDGCVPEGMDDATAELFPDSFEETDLGLVPRGWRGCALSEICKISSGKRPDTRSDNETVSANIPLFGGAGIMGFTSSSLFEDMKIVTGRVGTLGKVHIAYPPFWASDNVLVLTPLSRKHFYFCFHWLNAIDVFALNRGSTQPLLTQKDLGGQRRLLPSDGVLSVFTELVTPIYENIRLNTQRYLTLAKLRDALLPRLISGKLRLPDAVDALQEAA